MRFQSSRSPRLRQTSLFCAALAVASVPGGLAASPKFSVLYTFQGGTDGGNPYTETIVPGPNGSLYGSDRVGTTGSAAVFQLSPPADGSTPWNYTLLQSFTGDQNGGRPNGLMAGPAGSLIGETINGGNTACGAGCGLIFQLSPPTNGQTLWPETILYAFTGGADGEYPRDGLVADGQGNLFGTTVSSGLCGADDAGCGTVFELSPPVMGQTAWTLTTLYTFADDKSGFYPAGKLLPDQSGGFFGITWGGGKDGRQCNSGYSGCGTVYHLTPPGKKMQAWKKTTIYRFGAYPDGQTPFTTLNLDAAGNLYGMAMNGGLHTHCHQMAPGGCGTLFELSPPSGGKGAWTYSVPWEFTGGVDGRQPTAAGLLPFKGGYLTTTAGNEVNDFGSIDLFTPGTSGQPWTEQTLFTFANDANGENPSSYLLENDGVFYGMTRYGSSLAPYGTVFSFKP
jgi:hypothetical protein